MSVTSVGDSEFIESIYELRSVIASLDIAVDLEIMCKTFNGSLGQEYRVRENYVLNYLDSLTGGELGEIIYLPNMGLLFDNYFKSFGYKGIYDAFVKKGTDRIFREKSKEMILTFNSSALKWLGYNDFNSDFCCFNEDAVSWINGVIFSSKDKI
jgi:hypothetical protein